MSTVERHRTAMQRTSLSRPMTLAFEDGLLDERTAVFDFGCGRGGDIRHLRLLGFDARGWDPAHAPDEPLVAADVVNLGYVINVIEDISERRTALQRAWELTRRVLVVSARLDWESPHVDGRPFGDGILTSKGTFQKLFAHDELRVWIDSTLGVRSVAAAPGIFYVFRTPSAAQSLLARHSRTSAPSRTVAELVYLKYEDLLESLGDFVDTHRRLPGPTEIETIDPLVAHFGSVRGAFGILRRATDQARWQGVDLGTPRRSEERFQAHLDLLQPLIDFVSERGRLPREGEVQDDSPLLEEFGSIRAAFSLVRRVTGDGQWDEYAERARRDTLVYVALSAFGGRPKFSDLSPDLQFDIKDFFGSYKAACEEADNLLFSLGDTDLVSKICATSDVGKLTPEALYAHTSAIPRLHPLLRVYEGCARILTGAVEGGTVVKLHRQKPQVSYLLYPDFLRNPHPQVRGSVVARLGRLHVSYKDFSESSNPAILHRKDLLVHEDHPEYEKFRRLTLQEERAGLLDRANIGRQDAWDIALNEAGLRLRGHRLLRHS